MLINDPLVMLSNQALQHYRGREGVLQARPFLQVSTNLRGKSWDLVPTEGGWPKDQAKEGKSIKTNIESVFVANGENENDGRKSSRV